MSFRFWAYLSKGGFAVLFVAAALGFIVWPSNPVWRVMRVAALGGLILLCCIGGVLGLLMTVGRLRMGCPLCGAKGVVGVDERGPLLACDACGTVRTAGVLGLKFVKQPPA